MNLFNVLVRIAAIACASFPMKLLAVSLSLDGVGQALVYPYYTVQTSRGDSQNTYVSVVNNSPEAKAVRVRFREGRSGRTVASFNLFLSANDAWAGAVGPTGGGFARLTSIDRSCTSPAFTGTAGQAPGITFTNSSYTGAFADRFGTEPERTYEGWIEIIEMAVLTGASATAISHDSTGTPVNCDAVQGNASLAVAAPGGGLSGTLTVINVANGLNFTVNAEALADLAARPFYRPAADAYPDFTAAEIDPVSTVIANGSIYRSNWVRPVDAVSAALMRSTWQSEINLDSVTRSQTDFVMTYPTRQHYVTGGNQSSDSIVAPFANSCPFGDQLTGEPVRIRYVDREEKSTTWSGGSLLNCFAAEVMDFTTDEATPSGMLTTRVLASKNRAQREINVPASFQSGWASIETVDRPSPMTSQPSSTRINLQTGAVTTGAHAYYGLPVVGFSARTYVNGMLPCSGGLCLGNYGGAYPLKYTRKIATM